MAHERPTGPPLQLIYATSQQTQTPRNKRRSFRRRSIHPQDRGPWRLPPAGDTAPIARVQGRSSAVAGVCGVSEARRYVGADKGGGRQVRDGAQGGAGRGHPGPHHEGARDAELHRGARARGRRAGGRVEGRALPARG